MMNLTELEQKRLTEWLGECWHEWKNEHKADCLKCRLDGRTATNYGYIDFDDWKVVGRLIENIGRVDIYYHRLDNVWCARFGNNRYLGIGVTAAEAICRACLAYIEEVEK